MTRAAVALAAAIFAACAALPPRTDLLYQARGWRARVVATAAQAGGGRDDEAAGAALAQAARRAGLRAGSLNDPAAGLPGLPLTLDSLSDPRTLARVREVSGADAVVLLRWSAGASEAELAAIDARTGDVVLRARLVSRAGPFADGAAAGAAAQEALSSLAGRETAPRLDDLP